LRVITQLPLNLPAAHILLIRIALFLQPYKVPGLSTNEEAILEYPLPMPINLPPRDFILRLMLWTTAGPNEHIAVVVFNETISVIEESKIIDTELLGLYIILLACFAAAAYGALTFAQGKGWVKKTRKTKSAPGKIFLSLIITFC
jgi:hypothetical protein